MTKAPLRRAISAENPLIMFRPIERVESSYEGEHDTIVIKERVHEDSMQQMEQSLALQPAFLRPYLAVHIGVFPYRPTEADMELLDSQMTACDALGLDVVWEIAGWNSNDCPERYGECVSLEQAESMLAKHPCIIGLDIVEQSCCGGMNDVRTRYIADMLQLAARYGARVIWKEMGYPTLVHPMVYVGFDAAFMATVREYRDYLVMVDKRNGTGKHLTSSGVSLAWWLMGLCDAWGVNAETWMQYEAGYAKLFTPSWKWRLSRPHSNPICWQSILSAPETAFLQQMLPGIAMGATVYSFEAYNQLAGEQGPMPALTDAVAPLFRAMLEERLIPDMDTVKQVIRAAYRTDDADAPEVTSWGYELYRGLCWSDTPDAAHAENKCSLEWLPRCGRYHTIPLPPALATAEELSAFPEVIASADYARLFPDNGAKKAWFDARYPEEVAGTAWGSHVGDCWYIMHPQENVDDEKDFALTLKKRSIALSGVLHHHTVLYGREEDTRIRLHINDLCGNTDGVWDGSFGMEETFDPNAWMQHYRQHADFSRRRNTRLEIRGTKEARVTGENFAITRRETADGLVLDIVHNGLVTVEF